MWGHITMCIRIIKLHQRNWQSAGDVGLDCWVKVWLAWIVNKLFLLMNAVKYLCKYPSGLNRFWLNLAKTLRWIVCIEFYFKWKSKFLMLVETDVHVSGEGFLPQLLYGRKAPVPGSGSRDAWLDRSCEEVGINSCMSTLSVKCRKIKWFAPLGRSPSFVLWIKELQWKVRSKWHYSSFIRQIFSMECQFR